MDGQKRLSPNLSVDGPGIGSVSSTAAANVATDIRNSISSPQNFENFEQDALTALSSLDTVDNELYVSKFTNTTTCYDIMQYLRQHQCDTDKVKVFMLKKKDQDVTMLSFVSFKIETNNEIASKLLRPKFWPKGSYAKKFVKKATPVSDLGNFLSVTKIPNHTR